MSYITFILLIFTAAILTFSVILSFIRIPSYRTYKLAQKIKGPNKFSIIGMAVDLAREDVATLLQFFKNLSDQYGGIVRAWFLGVPMVLITSPEFLKVILGDANHNMKKGWEYDYTHDWFGEGIFSSVGDKWKEKRKSIAPSFNLNILDANLKCMNKQAFHLIKNLKKQNGNTNVKSTILYTTLKILCETAMGVTINPEDESGKNYIESLTYVMDSVIYRVMHGIYMKDWMFRLTPLGKKYDFNKKRFHEFAENVIRERKAVFLKENQEENFNETGQKKRKAFLDTLLDLQALKKCYQTDDEIKQETEVFMLAGHDTTAAALTFAIFSLANNQSIQEKAYEEQQIIFGDCDRDATNDDLHQMYYLTKVIKETLRMYPSAPYTSRELVYDAVCGETIIPKGSNIIIMPYVIHRNEKIYPNPQKFDPERFSHEECEKRHPYAYVPFGAGPRNCIGQKFAMAVLKVVLSKILREFKLLPVTTPEHLVLTAGIVLDTKDPIVVNFLPRKNMSSLMKVKNVCFEKSI